MSVTDTAIRNAEPTDKPFKLYDGDGLVFVSHAWRWQEVALQISIC